MVRDASCEKVVVPVVSCTQDTIFKNITTGVFALFLNLTIQKWDALILYE